MKANTIIFANGRRWLVSQYSSRSYDTTLKSHGSAIKYLVGNVFLFFGEKFIHLDKCFYKYKGPGLQSIDMIIFGLDIVMSNWSVLVCVQHTPF